MNPSSNNNKPPVYTDEIAKKIGYLKHAVEKKPLKNMNPRRNFVWGFIGANRTGKTTIAIGLAKSWKSANPRKQIIAFDPQGFFEKGGLVNVLIKPSNKDWARTLCKQNPDGTFKYANSLLILDDYRQLHPNDGMDTGFLDLLHLRARMNMDIIYIVHAPKLVLERLAYYTTHFSIFFTLSQNKGFSEKIGNYIACQKASVIINKYVVAYDLLNKGTEIYPNFPYIIVKGDNDSKIEPVNIDKRKLLTLLNESEDQSSNRIKK